MLASWVCRASVVVPPPPAIACVGDMAQVGRGPFNERFECSRRFRRPARSMTSGRMTATDRGRSWSLEPNRRSDFRATTVDRLVAAAGGCEPCSVYRCRAGQTDQSAQPVSIPRTFPCRGLLAPLALGRDTHHRQQPVAALDCRPASQARVVACRLRQGPGGIRISLPLGLLMLKLLLLLMIHPSPAHR